MIKVIAVDFGGVYFTYDSGNFTDELCKATGAPPARIRKALEKRIRDVNIGKITEKEYWDSFRKAAGIGADYRILHKITHRQFRPVKPVISLMKKLRKKYRIALLANQSAMLDELDIEYKFYRDFDIVLSSHIVKLQKPHRRMFMLLMKKAGAKPEEIIFIDDSQKNAAAARKLGINAIRFRNFRQMKSELDKMLGND